MKKFILITLLYLLTINFSLSQVTADEQVFSQFGDNHMIATSATKRKNIKIKGSPFINDSYLPIKLTSAKNKNLKARFNGYNGDMEVLDVATGKVFVLNKRIKTYKVKFIGLNKIYRIFNYKDNDDDLINGFFIELYNSEKLSLLKRESVQFLPEKIATTSYEKARKAQYKRGNDEFYVKIEDNSAQILPKKKKDIAKLFPEHSKNILSFIKKDKIKTSKEADLIKLVSYISNL